ncbi:PilT protein domain protein [Thermodesulfobacterium geofontis OPF15]|jgi:predicted nucleic acid-binding protein|uniref:PilT protein domain protein n=1 Tax=Thermodesulfobacterium geofontis (strain OPF15) TaxID=795359 RepID=F8C641_THEGP|nr:PIN domain-containing protein [Thermodesulfobacterium geofontis]AEH23192.1 PilT protein domain protein [Thermodesulfobacterium geofontis OPF15]
MRKFLDTNIFLRYLTKDDEEKAYKVLDLLKKIERGEEKAITSPLVIFELIFTLQKYYKLLREEIRDLVLPLINLRGLKIPYKAVFEKALETFPNTNVSFADLFNYFFMLEHEVKEIYSYDEDFNKLPEIKRLVP